MLNNSYIVIIWKFTKLRPVIQVTSVDGVSEDGCQGSGRKEEMCNLKTTCRKILLPAKEVTLFPEWILY